MSEAEPRWEISLTRQAEKTLYHLSKNLLQRLDQAILALAANPRPPVCQQLPEHNNLYRLYVDEWRIVYAVEEERLIVLILEIAPKQQPERYQLEEEIGEPPSATQGKEWIENASLSEDFYKALIAQPVEDNIFYRTLGAKLYDEKIKLLGIVKGASQAKIRVLIVDDMAETRENLRKLLYLESDIEIVGAATNGEAAIQMAVEQQPDVVLMDIIMPGINGLTATEIICEQVPSAQVIIMSVHGEADFLRQAMAAGAREFLIKPFSNDELMTSIRRVYQSIALQKRQATALHSSLRDVFKELKERIQAKLMAELDSIMDVSHSDEVRRIIQDRFERILIQENIILSRSEQERLLENIVTEVLGFVDASRRAGNEKIRLLIVDNISATREKLTELLSAEPDIEIIGAATNGEEAIQMAVELQPDVVLMEIILPGINGLAACEIISQQVPSTKIIMMSAYSEPDYHRRSMLAGATEFLTKAVSPRELMSSIRQVGQSRPTMGEKQATKPQSETETGLGESQIKATALWFKFYKLGNNVEISLSVADLSAALSFYQKLGLERVDGGEKPYPWAVVSDGRLHLGLHQQVFSSPTLSYFAIWALSERMVHLQKLGVRLDNIQKFHRIVIMPQNFATAEFESPEGQRVLLADLASDVETTPSGRKFFPKCQSFGELSLKTEDLNATVSYWERLGFERVAEGNQPYPWAIVSDGRIRLGFHQTPKLTQPTITYFAPDMPDRLKRLRRRGIKFMAEHKDRKGRRVGAVIQSPDGQSFFLFTGEIKPQMNGSRQEVGIDEENRPRPEDAQWYKIHTYAGSEGQVRQNLLHRIEAMGMQDKIFRVVLPNKKSEVKLLPGGQHLAGYILVEMIVDENSWYVVKNTPGVTGFFGSGDKLMPLSPAEVDQFLKRADTEAPQIKVNFKVGQKVRVVEGPFEDFIGIVDEIDLDRARVRVLVSFFGQEKPVELDFYQIERV